ncbi:hypothetical protein [Caldimonas tepidiphila]|uniref:hypothetical protein n=1 Tax=Caldimonas tepidiphila TaxID=2315841 RepID=UPI001F0C958A|nr:hypothetical protein [Caldimonas tepidiphila]
MRYLTFDLSEGADGVTTLEALASTSAEHQAEVLAEAQQVLDWARQRFPDTHGPVEEGMDWDHDLQVSVEDGQWHSVTLTLSGSPRFVEEFFARFGSPETW